MIEPVSEDWETKGDDDERKRKKTFRWNVCVKEKGNLITDPRRV